MTFTLSRLLDDAGNRVRKPETIKGATLDVDRHGHASAFVDEKLVADLDMMRFEAHANGLYLYGYERIGKRVQAQNWFLAYES